MRVAITGSSGLIGSALTERLRAQGHYVLEMKRGAHDDPAAVWDPAAGWVRDGALADIEGIVNLGGASIGDGRWTADRKQVLRS
ncbi:MAG: NAD-dependent epimerase/dehydratase family protein, partial [Dehalococcoidia bacterium]